VTVPLPLPLAPPVTVIHEALLTAVHPQPDCAVTATVPVVALASMEMDPGAIVKTQGAPACVIVYNWPPIAIDPVRTDVLGLAAIE
jgi:hypothetical protein